MWIVTECENRNCELIWVSKGQEKETGRTRKNPILQHVDFLLSPQIIEWKMNGMYAMMLPQLKIFIVYKGENNALSVVREPEVLNFDLILGGCSMVPCSVIPGRN